MEYCYDRRLKSSPYPHWTLLAKTANHNLSKLQSLCDQLRGLVPPVEPQPEGLAPAEALDQAIEASSKLFRFFLYVLDGGSSEEFDHLYASKKTALVAARQLRTAIQYDLKKAYRSALLASRAENPNIPLTIQQLALTGQVTTNLYHKFAENYGRTSQPA